MDFLGYRNKRVIVSGCFSGMGEATARRLLELGAEVHGFDIREPNLPLASFHAIDLRDPASVDAAVAAVGGPIDALFNCAGLPNTFPPMDVMKVNYIGTRHLTERVIPLMSRGGAVASISSTGGMGWSRRLPVLLEFAAVAGFEAAVAWCEAHPEVVAEGYSFSKEMVIVWTMLASQEFIERGIRINCTMPGPTRTPMSEHFDRASGRAIQEFFTQPIRRYSEPREQGDALVFLNSAAASYVNGVVLPVDGGFMAGVATGRIDLAGMMAKSAQQRQQQQ
ncbi:MAG: 3-alpha-hydroxysteroid dehydrogenase [Porticoccaceae bacterium]|nr:MAG: 3-alpha-hydroxysteroid dehydrogenase [Porticoccaceae bacterium]